MTDLIKCIKCDHKKPVNAFYLSTIRKSKQKGECIDCVCERVTAADSKPHRRAYFASEEFKIKNRECFQKYVSKYPGRKNARDITKNAIASGKLVKADNCEQCNSSHKIEAHHDDYNKALDVRWLCRVCHGIWHRYNTPVYQSH